MEFSIGKYFSVGYTRDRGDHKVKIEEFLIKYTHSLFTLGLGMAIIFISIHFIQTRGPSFLKAPAAKVGGIVGGNAYGF